MGKKKSTWNLSLLSKNIWVYACWGMVMGSTSSSSSSSSFGFFFFKSSSSPLPWSAYYSRSMELEI